MSLFDPNAYGRPKAKARRVQEPVPEGKHALLEGYYYFDANIMNSPEPSSKGSTERCHKQLRRNLRLITLRKPTSANEWS